MASINITQGTQTAIVVDTVGTTNYQVVKLDVGTAGVSVPFTDFVSPLPANTWGTTINVGTSTQGTLWPAVAGSVIYLTDLIISVGSASNVVIGMGTSSVPLIGTLSFAANGGLVTNFTVPRGAISGSAIVYQQSANGPLSISAHGFIK